MTESTPALRQRVITQRRQLGWDLRRAAQVSGVSRTTWSRFESGDTATVSNQFRAAVVTAFGWPDDWPENPPPLAETNYETLADVATRLDDQERLLRDIAAHLGVSLPGVRAPARSDTQDGEREPPARRT